MSGGLKALGFRHDFPLLNPEGRFDAAKPGQFRRITKMQKIEVLTYNILTRQPEYLVVSEPLAKRPRYCMPKGPKISKPCKKKAKAAYYREVWCITLANDLTELMAGKERGFHKHHIDHIIPISFGFKNGVPASEIGHRSNLRPLYWRDNLKKAAKYKP